MANLDIMRTLCPSFQACHRESPKLCRAWSPKLAGIDSKRLCPAGDQLWIQPKAWGWEGVLLFPERNSSSPGTNAHTHSQAEVAELCSGIRKRAMGQSENIFYLMNVDAVWAGRWNQSSPSLSLPVSKRFSGDLRARNRRVAILHNSGQVRVGLAGACRRFYLSAKVKCTACVPENRLNGGQVQTALILPFSNFQLSWVCL